MSVRQRYLVGRLFALCLLLLLVGFIARPGEARYAGRAAQGSDFVDPQEVAYRELLEASEGPAHVYFTNGFPRSVVALVPAPGDTPVERAVNFLNTYEDLYLQNDPNLSYIIRTTRGDENQFVVVEQAYKGVRVHLADMTVQVDDRYVYGTSGGLLPQGVELDPTPHLWETDAEAIARAEVEQPDAPIVAQTRLLVFDRHLFDTLSPSDPRLVWRVNVAGVDPYDVYVDAHTGEVVFKLLLRDHFDLDLEDANGSNAEDTNCYWNTTDDDEIGDSDGVYPEAQNDQDAVAAWNAAAFVYNFYLGNFGRDSYDDDDGQIEVYVHATPKNTIANWIGASTDCDLIQFQTGGVSNDIMAHEFTHAVVDYTSDLWGTNQPGALNEAFGDIMAAVAEQNWLLPTGTTGGMGAFRSGTNPPDFSSTLSDVGSVPHPDKMSNYVMTTDDDGGEHVNNGIIVKAASLLALGGTHNGVTINALGYSKTRHLMYRTMIGVPSGAQFMDARNLAVAVAAWFAGNGWYGFTPQDVCTVRMAFYSVELGNPDFNCDGWEENPDPDSDGVAIQNDNCPNAFNPGQQDLDGDGLGDHCDNDNDGDGIPEHGPGPYLPDNCPGLYNPDQKDANLNGIGEACDPTEDEDFDDDGILNDVDNCRFEANSDQADMDNDGVGDACDSPDLDDDQISTDDDNCPMDANPDQLDSDGDGIGDACDLCPDDFDSGVSWSNISIPGSDTMNIKINVPDSDGDGIPDACDNNYSIGIIDTEVAGDLPEFGLKPDCELRRVRVSGGPLKYVRIPIVPDEGLGMMDWIPPDITYELTLMGLNDDIRFWVLNDDGMTVDEAPHIGETRKVDWRPEGGQVYYLILHFGPDVEPEEQFEIQELMSRYNQAENVRTSNCPQPTTPPTEEATQLPMSTPEATEVPISTPPNPDAERCLAMGLGEDNVNVRALPDIASPVVATLQPGEIAVVIGTVPDRSWWEVIVDEGEGWVANFVVDLIGPCDDVPLTGRRPEPDQPSDQPDNERVGENCPSPLLTHPREGLPNDTVMIFWNPVAMAALYRVNVYGEGGLPLLVMQEVPAPNTSVEVDVSSAAIGEGFQFELEVQAFDAAGVLLCSEKLRILRESPISPSDDRPQEDGEQPPAEEPVCGDRMCHASEIETDAAGRQCTRCPDCAGQVPRCA